MPRSSRTASKPIGLVSVNANPIFSYWPFFPAGSPRSVLPRRLGSQEVESVTERVVRLRLVLAQSRGVPCLDPEEAVAMTTLTREPEPDSVEKAELEAP